MMISYNLKKKKITKLKVQIGLNAGSSSRKRSKRTLVKLLQINIKKIRQDLLKFAKKLIKWTKRLAGTNRSGPLEKV